jgi:dihydroxy-acid dehydratase
MGAASCDIPTLVVSGGPMPNGKYRGQDIGSGTGVWRLSEEVKTGAISLQDFMDAEACMSRSAGHCMTMGTASTMASMVEALGLALPHNAAIPAVGADFIIIDDPLKPDEALSESQRKDVNQWFDHTL